MGEFLVSEQRDASRLLDLSRSEILLEWEKRAAELGVFSHEFIFDFLQQHIPIFINKIIFSLLNRGEQSASEVQRDSSKVEHGLASSECIHRYEILYDVILDVLEAQGGVTCGESKVIRRALFSAMRSETLTPPNQFSKIDYSRDDFRLFLENTSGCFFALDRNWCFTFLNTQAELLLKRTRQQLLGKTIWSAFPEAVGSAFQKNYERAIAENSIVTFEEYYPPRHAWFRVKACPFHSGLSVLALS